MVLSMIDDKYRSSHLFLLIGTNPLPNYVAAQLLWKNEEPDSRLFMVYSPGTMDVAERLADALNLDWNIENGKLERIQVDQANPSDIYRQVQEKAKNLGGDSIGLHYTGGTKAMAVHAFRAMENLKIGCLFSYLDPDKLRFVFANSDDQISESAPIPLDKYQVSINTMVWLHGYCFTNLECPKKEPLMPEFVQEWANIDERERSKWINTELKSLVINLPEYSVRDQPDGNILLTGKEGKLGIKDPSDKIKTNYPLKGFCVSEKLNVSGKVTHSSCYWQNNSELNVAKIGDLLGEKFPDLNKERKELVEKWQKKSDELVKYLNSLWLEHYVLNCINKVGVDCQIHESGMNVKPFYFSECQSQPTQFEFDVFAIKGYQLFGLSCTTSDDKDLIKLKLMEAFVRVRQMGGDEARVGLVVSSWNPTEMSQFKNNLKESWKSESNQIEVFGKDDIKDLSEKLKIWFNGGNPHGK